MYFVIYGRFLWLWPQEMWDVHNQLNDQQMCNYDTKMAYGETFVVNI